MKKFLLAALVVWASLVGAQSIPTTPNINLYVPYHGTPNWDTYMNADMNFLDSFLSGGTPLNLFKVNQYIDFSAIAAPTPPASPFCRFYYDVGAGQMTGINSLGGPCSSSGGGGSGSVVAPGGAGTPLAYFPDGTAASVTGDPNTSDDGAGNVTVNSLATAGAGGIGLLITPSFQIVPDVFSTLLTCDPSLEGYFATVTDSSSNVLGDTITGFGTFHVIGYCDGINWVVSGVGNPYTLPGGTVVDAFGDITSGDNGLNIFPKNGASNPEIQFTCNTDVNCQIGVTSKTGGQFFSQRNNSPGSEPDFDFFQGFNGNTLLKFIRITDTLPTGFFTQYQTNALVDVASLGVDGTWTATKTKTVTNCAAVGTSANPSVASCSAAPAGSFSCAVAASTGTCVVNTTAVTANSEILITQRTDTTAGTRLSVTCNTGVSTVLPVITAVSAGVSFTINLGTVAVNPECFSYNIVN